MSTTLSTDFLQAALLVTNFKGKRMMAIEAALLTMAVNGEDFTACDIPDVLVNGSKNLAGCACGALVAQGLLKVVTRIKSTKPNAKGRKLDVFRIADGKRETARTWLSANGFKQPEARQAELSLA